MSWAMAMTNNALKRLGSDAGGASRRSAARSDKGVSNGGCNLRTNPRHPGFLPDDHVTRLTPGIEQRGSPQSKIMRHIALATAALTLAASPAVAAPIPVPDAQAALALAVSATNSAPSYQYTSSYLGESATWNAAGQYAWTRDGRETRQFSDDTYYESIVWPSVRVRTKVRSPRYLDDPALEWQSIGVGSRYRTELDSWPDLVADPALRLGHVRLTLSTATFADRTTTATSTQYTVGDGRFDYAVTVDAGGRIIRLATTRFDGMPATDRAEEWTFGTVTVERPAALPIETVRRALQAATLNATIRDLTRERARQSNRRGDSLRRMRVMTEEAVALTNGTGDGSQDEPLPRFVKLKVRNVPGGVRVFRTNPYTGTKHEWRITQRSGRWTAFRTQP
jgi:hypothetical protein